MLNEKEITEIKEIISKSENPIYLFDDDVDGISAYLILYKYYKKGIGIPIKSAGPKGIDDMYIKKIEEEKPDLLIILDKPVIMQEFIDKMSCEVIIIDHHKPIKIKRAKYYNPQLHKRNVPTSYIAYQITQDSLWISFVGCIFDYHIPDFIKEFKKQYPDLIDKIVKDPAYIAYNTKVGELIKIFSFNIKGQDINKSLKELEKISSPYEILNQTTNEGKNLFKKYEKLNKEYMKLLEKAKKESNEENMLLFIYPSSKTSFTRELSNELNYLFKERTTIIAREKQDKYIMSIRNQKIDISRIVKKALLNLNGFGGGHKLAVGCSVAREDFSIFIDRIKNLAK